MSEKIAFIEGSNNLFKDFGFNEFEAKKLKLRARLMIVLTKYIHYENISQKEAAKRFNISQSRMSNLIHGRIELFSNDMLIEILDKVGFRIYDAIERNINEITVKHWLNTKAA